ncbi:hypothetical protein HK405_012684 [Cladochytrium tenue]|nr:hypothetical protein HK405_012684 [Cladochytrium tenue]
MQVTLGILLVSDSVSNGTSKDRSSLALKEFAARQSWFVLQESVVFDDVEEIRKVLQTWTEQPTRLDLILTTGGTGFGVRDVTPEAVSPLLEKHAPGLVTAMLTSSLKITPLAALSRPVAGVRGRTLIVTLPGSPKGAVENLEAIASILPHAIDLARGGDSRAAHATPIESLQSGFLARVTTGAPVPDGADAVVMVEDTEVAEMTADNEEAFISVLARVVANENIREIGSDVRKGDVILDPGSFISAQGGGAALSSSFPGIDIVSLGPARDEPQSLKELLEEGLRLADVVITTGGVSMGEADIIKPVLERELVAFGVVADVLEDDRAKLIFSLPGNPVSALVGIYVFVLPALRKMAGFPDPRLPVLRVKLGHAVEQDPRPEFQRARVVVEPGSGELVAHGTGSQRSSRMLSMRGANALLVVPPAQETPGAWGPGSAISGELEEGTLVDAWMTGAL